jgi:hypothetical protein
MEKETLKNIFNFLEENERHQTPFLWKWVNNIPLTEKDLNIEGELDLTNTDIKSLPDGLKVAGDLNLTETDMRLLPERLEVAGNLYLDHSFIKSLPKDLKIGGDLSIEATYIKSLPRGLQVGGDLYLNDSRLLNYIDYNDSNELRDIVKKMVEPGFIKGNVIFNQEGYNWLKSDIYI